MVGYNLKNNWLLMERKYPMGNHSGTRKCQIRRRTHGSLYDRFHEENSLPVLRLSKTSWHKAPCRRQADYFITASGPCTTRRSPLFSQSNLSPRVSIRPITS